MNHSYSMILSPAEESVVIYSATSAGIALRSHPWLDASLPMLRSGGWSCTLRSCWLIYEKLLEAGSRFLWRGWGAVVPACSLSPMPTAQGITLCLLPYLPQLMAPSALFNATLPPDTHGTAYSVHSKDFFEAITLHLCLVAPSCWTLDWPTSLQSGESQSLFSKVTRLVFESLKVPIPV